MRNRILASSKRLRHARLRRRIEFSMESLAHARWRVRSARGWNLLDLPSQLRISTIDSFCRDLALQQPLLSGLGGGLGISEQPDELYRRAARATLKQLGADTRPANADSPAPSRPAARWRDNNWQDIEEQLVRDARERDRWMHDFVLNREQDWEPLRERLERPFARAVREALSRVEPASRPGPRSPRGGNGPGAFRLRSNAKASFIANWPSWPIFPPAPLATHDELEDARQAFVCLADLLLTDDGSFRKSSTSVTDFPPTQSARKRDCST